MIGPMAGDPSGDGVLSIDVPLAVAEEETWVELNHHPSGKEALELIPEAYAATKCLIPLFAKDGLLTIVAADDLPQSVLNELPALTRHSLRVWRGDRADIEEAIRRRYRVLEGVGEHVRAFNERADGRAAHVASSRNSVLSAISADSPVVQIANLIITQGLRDRASDIHIEPQEAGIRIRYRIDGLLSDVLTLPAEMGPSLASRIKVMANLDIVDRHRAQDGQIRITGEDRQVDIRVSTAETIWGEKVVLRLLDQGRTFLSLDELGLAEQAYERLARLTSSPYGMIVVSGPTGSGKTTTLYAAIKELDPISQNITTIEDPVEYTFENINQIQIRKVANLTFANGLKAILRQDPDVILVGEIRDLETAEIAIQSALTGHLVLSSLHATDAAGVVQRFIEMGIEGFLISSALVGVVAQRLVRRICSFCLESYSLTIEEKALWKQYGQGEKTTFVRGAGCPQCAGTGYRGRVGVFEVLEMSETIKRMVSARLSAQEIREQALKEGMVGLRGNAVQKVASDITTLSEVIRCVWLV